MMKTIIFLFLLMPLVSVSDPLDRFIPENVAGAARLKDQLVGSIWSYKWRGREYEFSFESDGSISKLKSWSMVSWVVTAPNEVVLEGVSDRMVLLFNDHATKFQTIDWDGEESSGIILKRENKY